MITEGVLESGTRYWYNEDHMGRLRGVAICRAAGITHAYCLGSGAGSYWLRYGFDQAPVDELVAVLPNAPQVIDFARCG